MKPYAKNTITRQIFEKVFLEKLGKNPDNSYIFIPRGTKGGAINLAQGLNKCNRADMEEKGVPLEMSNLSARPLEVNGIWGVQLTESWKHRTKPNQGLLDVLEYLKEAGPEAQDQEGQEYQSQYTPEQLKLQARLKQQAEEHAELKESLSEEELMKRDEAEHQRLEDEKMLKILGLG